MNKQLKTIGLIHITILVIIVVPALLFIRSCGQFNEHPALALVLPSASLVSSSLNPPCSRETTLRGNTQFDLYEYTSAESIDQITQFYEGEGAICVGGTTQASKVVCRKEYGDSISYVIYIEDLPNDTEPASEILIEVRWGCYG